MSVAALSPSDPPTPHPHTYTSFSYTMSDGVSSLSIFGFTQFPSSNPQHLQRPFGFPCWEWSATENHNHNHISSLFHIFSVLSTLAWGALTVIKTSAFLLASSSGLLCLSTQLNAYSVIIGCVESNSYQSNLEGIRSLVSCAVLPACCVALWEQHRATLYFKRWV